MLRDIGYVEMPLAGIHILALKAARRLDVPLMLIFNWLDC